MVGDPGAAPHFFFMGSGGREDFNLTGHRVAKNFKFMGSGVGKKKLIYFWGVQSVLKRIHIGGRAGCNKKQQLFNYGASHTGIQITGSEIFV